MLTTRCPLLSKNAKLLQDLYNVRHKMMGREGSAAELRAVEYDLIRMHRVIKRHRMRCPQCKLNDGFTTRLDVRLRPLPSEAPFLPVQVY
jgi:hypothetical protein